VWGDRVTYAIVPLADGGEGTVTAFTAAGAQERRVSVHGPLGDPVVAAYALERELAVLEMAAASGLALLGERRDPRHASTVGTGELIRDALDAGARSIVLGIGGSATTDGAAGALAALGMRFLDAAGRPLEPVPAALAGLAAIDSSGLDPRLAQIDLAIAADVDAPLLGPAGTAAVYGPQKGAKPDDVRFLEAVLRRFADLAAAATGRDLRDRPGSGAAGGLGWGLATFAGARMERGFELVSAARGFPATLRGAALCITGEGRIDDQTLHGKVVAGVGALGAQCGVPVVAFGGSVEPAAAAALAARGVTCVAVGDPSLDLATAMREAPVLIRAAASRFARSRPAPT
jgi:glycerate 2-kinase